MASFNPTIQIPGYGDCDISILEALKSGDVTLAKTLFTEKKSLFEGEHPYLAGTLKLVTTLAGGYVAWETLMPLLTTQAPFPLAGQTSFPTITPENVARLSAADIQRISKTSQSVLKWLKPAMGAGGAFASIQSARSLVFKNSEDFQQYLEQRERWGTIQKAQMDKDFLRQESTEMGKEGSLFVFNPMDPEKYYNEIKESNQERAAKRRKIMRDDEVSSLASELLLEAKRESHNPLESYCKEDGFVVEGESTALVGGNTVDGSYYGLRYDELEEGRSKQDKSVIVEGAVANVIRELPKTSTAKSAISVLQTFENLPNPTTDANKLKEKKEALSLLRANIDEDRIQSKKNPNNSIVTFTLDDENGAPLDFKYLEKYDGAKEPEFAYKTGSESLIEAHMREAEEELKDLIEDAKDICMVRTDGSLALKTRKYEHGGNEKYSSLRHNPTPSSQQVTIETLYKDLNPK